MSDSPSTASVILTSFTTALVTAVATVLLMQRLAVAPAEQRVPVPDLTGLTQQDALTNLQARGLTLRIGGRKVSRDKPADTVLSQSLLAGTKVDPGTTVTVVIADEAPPSVPDVRHRTTGEATLLLEQAGYKIAFGEPVPHDSIPKGKIISQVPAAETPLEAGRTVTVLLSDGPRLGEVPRLLGQSVNRAKKAIEDAGFAVGTIQWDYDPDWGPYAVLRQTPGPGEQAAPGTAINMVVNQGD